LTPGGLSFTPAGFSTLATGIALAVILILIVFRAPGSTIPACTPILSSPPVFTFTETAWTQVEPLKRRVSRRQPKKRR
jgi:hypothetical protein